MPPGVGFGERADGGTGKTAPPLIVHIGPELVTSEPIDLVFFNSVKDYLIAEGDTVGGTSVSAFAADLAEVLNADVDGLVRYQRQVGQNGIRHMDAGAVSLVDDEPVSAQLANASGYSCGLWSYHSSEGRVPQFFNVAFQGLQDEYALHLRNMVGGVADVMAVSLELVVVPCRRRLDDIGKFPHQLLRRLSLICVLRRAVLDVTAAGIQKGRMRLGNADDIGSHIVRHGLDVARHRCRVLHSNR